MFVTLADIYEPSAVQQLPNGRFLIAEDEKAHPFSLATIRADGSSTSVPLQMQQADDESSESPLAKLDDLEGLTSDADGYVYAITSHSRNSAGEEKKSREKLVRFRIEGNRVVSASVVRCLKAALAAAHPVLATAAAILDVKEEGGLNIEALEMTPDGRHLLVGFRSPLLEGQALVASIDNPAEIFDRGAAPRISPQLEKLDLGGHGIRGMSYVPALAGYLVISGPVAKERKQFRLWRWSGRSGERPQRASVPGIKGFEHAEGLCPAIVDGQQRIVVVSDDGSRADGRAARFMLLEPGQIVTGCNS